MHFESENGGLYLNSPGAPAVGQRRPARELVGFPVGRRPADYALVEEELHRNDPDLAAQTRFLQPAQAQPLRLIRSQSDRAQTFRQIINDQDDNDTANFLFVPVNDGGVTGGGADWSLLRVDGACPPPALPITMAPPGLTTAPSQIAARLGSRLQAARMARQQNGHDCGVFVVDAKRALIRRLSQGERPDDEPLHTEHLIADRQALRSDLRVVAIGADRARARRSRHSRHVLRYGFQARDRKQGQVRMN
ncbi:hypothetical protein XH94_23275 [Bradyrhizobium zhanjiangense]|uniref:Ubiquitin-like protease family profile domain-containing protein n=1 Tax=Bradyrhizobium zhanjiangense TaxID=1325107 RepID=A0A4V1L3J5_9BRAD|nr:hypothetical protein XH94_23275 [Bradyrhizobium zhanjiangense]